MSLDREHEHVIRADEDFARQRSWPRTRLDTANDARPGGVDLLGVPWRVGHERDRMPGGPEQHADRGPDAACAHNRERGHELSTSISLYRAAA